eukprot:GILJ01016402.1.p1 GENE.GILJ01016402.1~~GILJ01016402.1.p1  ORF type:complete len:126 (+),score=10.27 GILJ01016402.1:174-551(+)
MCQNGTDTTEWLLAWGLVLKGEDFLNPIQLSEVVPLPIAAKKQRKPSNWKSKPPVLQQQRKGLSDTQQGSVKTSVLNWYETEDAVGCLWNQCISDVSIGVSGHDRGDNVGDSWLICKAEHEDVPK